MGAPTVTTIFGPHGEALSQVPVLGMASYYGAASDQPELRDWNPIAASADSELVTDVETLRGRTRDLVKNHGLGSSAMRTHIDYVLGVGLRLQAIPDYRALGRDAAWARDWARRVESLWRGWTEGPDRACDAARTSPMAVLSAQAFRGFMENGAGLALALWQPDRRVATTLQVVEADRLGTPAGKVDGRDIRGGIEIDAFGAPLAYWVRKAHPGDMFFGTGGLTADWERVPAETPWGRKRVIHVCDRERAEQHHGRPQFSAVLGEFRTLGEYQRAELQGALVNALVAAVLEAPIDGATIHELFGDGQSYVTARNQAPQVKLRRGAVLRTFPGETLKTFAPGRPNQAFEPFVLSLLRIMSAGLHLPYELLVKDWSKTNYSSARAALLDAWRYFMGRRFLMADQWYGPAYCLFLEEMVNRGKIEAPDYYDNLAAYTRALWVGPGRGWVDPLKEAAAAEKRLHTGISTLQQECAEQGLDWEDVLEQQAREQQKRRELGLPAPGAAPMDAALIDEQAEDERDERA